MVSAIANPVGLFKAGKSGAGGQYEPMTRIRRDIFQRTNMIYGLKMTGAFKDLDPQSIIIDIEYDGVTEEDPQASRPLIFVTDDPAQKDRGIWYGTFKAPNNRESFSALGTHTVRIRVAPRQAPRTDTMMVIVVPKDGATKIVRTVITKMVPVYTANACTGKMEITSYTEEKTATESEVPAETEITYTGYSVTQVLGPRDFSAAAGGMEATYPFEIFSSSLPPYDLPQE
ncbi:MAG: hypothetical protein PHT99_02420 [Methanoregula sp.]|nr:hypothetical protein [Methanoregula sp.]